MDTSLEQTLRAELRVFPCSRLDGLAARLVKATDEITQALALTPKDSLLRACLQSLVRDSLPLASLAQSASDSLHAEARHGQLTGD